MKLTLATLMLLTACTLPPDKQPVPEGTYLLRVVSAEEMKCCLGLARVNRSPCEIHIRHQSQLMGRRFEDILKHEAAHCHGWRHE